MIGLQNFFLNVAAHRLASMGHTSIAQTLFNKLQRI